MDDSKDRGFVHLARKFWDNEILKEKGRPFSKREAWLYIFSNLANGIDRNGIPRGQFEASYRFLSKKFLWSLNKTYRFIQELIDQKMLSRNPISIEHQIERFVERFTVCEYSTYNPIQNTSQNTKQNIYKERIKKDINNNINTNAKTIIKIPLKDGTEYYLTEDHLKQYQESYPGMDIEEQFRLYKGWAISNPEKRKTRSGILKSVNFWISGNYEKNKAQASLKLFTNSFGEKK